MKYPNKLAINLRIQELTIILLLLFFLFFIKIFVKTGLIPKDENEVNKKTKANKQFKIPNSSGPRYLAKNIKSKKLILALVSLSKTNQEKLYFVFFDLNIFN